MIKNSFTVFGTKTLKNKDRIILLRNPWKGAGKWTGKYSSKHDKDMTEEIKTELAYTKHKATSATEASTFYMKVEDFVNNFDTLIICDLDKKKFLNSFDEKNLEVSGKREGETLVNFYRVKIEKREECYFGISQIDNKLRGGNPYAFVNLTLIFTPNSKFEHQDGKFFFFKNF